MVFAEKPVAAGLLVLTLVILVFAMLPSIRKGREEAFQE